MDGFADGSAGMNVASNHVCDLCSESRFEPIARHDRHGVPLDTVVCRRAAWCSMHTCPASRSWPRSTRHEYRRQYKGEVSPSSRRHHAGLAQRGADPQSIDPYLTSGEKVLEVGSGIGCTVQVFDLAGYDAQGIEPNEGFCDYGQTKLHAHVRTGYLSDLPAEPRFDVVLLVHVIEHLASPRQALEQIDQMLRPAGGCTWNALTSLHRSRRSSDCCTSGISTTSRATRSGASRGGPASKSSTSSALADDPNLRLLFRKPPCRIIPAG